MLRSCIMVWKLSDAPVITTSLQSTGKPVEGPSWYKHPAYFSRSLSMKNGWQEGDCDRPRFPLTVIAEFGLTCIEGDCSSAVVPGRPGTLWNGSASISEEYLLSTVTKAKRMLTDTGEEQTMSPRLFRVRLETTFGKILLKKLQGAFLFGSWVSQWHGDCRKQLGPCWSHLSMEVMEKWESFPSTVIHFHGFEFQLFSSSLFLPSLSSSLPPSFLSSFTVFYFAFSSFLALFSCSFSFLSFFLFFLLSCSLPPFVFLSLSKIS